MRKSKYPIICQQLLEKTSKVDSMEKKIRILYHYLGPCTPIIYNLYIELITVLYKDIYHIIPNQEDIDNLLMITFAYDNKAT